jgi:predicted RNA-binding protein Jag
MKSLLQESSSVGSAIEKAWKSAGSPVSFSVKLIAEGEKNFFGFTKKPCIVSITYENNASSESYKNNKKPRTFPENRQFEKEPNSKPKFEKKEQFEQKEQRDVDTNKQTELWTPEDIDFMTDNISQFLRTIDANTTFITSEEGFLLRLKFDEPIIGAPSVEKSFAASLAQLSMQILRKKAKKPLRGLKLILDVIRD